MSNLFRFFCFKDSKQKLIMKQYALIVAGGIGHRMKAEIPKQFLELNGRPILMHTLDKFILADQQISLILVLPQVHHVLWKELCIKHNFLSSHLIVAGGESRFQSVKNGLQACENVGLISIHDGVRPLVSPKLILNLYRWAKDKKSAIPVCPMVESIRKIEGQESRSVDRRQYVSVQTPQCFSVELIQRAYLQQEQTHFTDDASVLEALGEKVHFIPGEVTNLKITRPGDLILAEHLLSFK